MTCPELDPKIARDLNKAKYYIRELLFACSEYNLDSKTADTLSGFIKDWQKEHGQMTFMSAVSLGTPMLDDKTYTDLRCVEAYMVDSWNELAQQHGMQPTTSQKVREAFDLVDSARLPRKDKNQTSADTNKCKESFGNCLFCVLLFGAIVYCIIMRGCEKRNYLIHPATDEEVEHQDAIHSRGG